MTKHPPDDTVRRSAERERQSREAGLDETIAASFPASDPASTDPNPKRPIATEVRDRGRQPDHEEKQP